MTASRFVRNKNARKVLRVLLQVVLLAVVSVVLVKMLFLKERYQPTALPVQHSASAQDSEGGDGFVALSYIGVAKEATETLISQELLDQHLKALKDAGYVTIEQEDIINYYFYQKPLPEKALFLFFEDGRRLSAILAQPLLEKYNLKASMLSYANNLESRSQLFLSAQELLSLKNNSYWELGSNGYRLSYVNVFDRHRNYLGELTPDEYVSISPYVRREYNHYLMDFLRDMYDIPLESPQQMQERIAGDYQLMKSSYEDKIGYLPGMYTLMHSNTGQFATEDKCSAENEKWINEMFSMNFNREMYCYNDRSGDIYDLSRMQPQAYWSVNHLIMRIRDDTGVEIPFEEGNAQKAGRWTVLYGAAEHKEDTIYLTSESESVGLIKLNGSEGYGNFYLSAQLNGNKLGTQSVDLLVDPDGSSNIAVEIKNNVLTVYPKQTERKAAAAVAETEEYQEEAETLFVLNLDEHDGIVYQTMEENRQEAMEVEIETKSAQKYKAEESAVIVEDLMKAKRTPMYSSKDLYIPDITLKDAGSRLLEITVHDGLLEISIDGKVAAEHLPIGPVRGGISLRSAWGEYGYSQRNLADDVYDGVFKSLYVTRLNGLNPDYEAVLFDNRAIAINPYVKEASDAVSQVIDWIRMSE